MSREIIDPYRAWLGLVTRPRHFYDLLGVAEMVQDQELIRMAAARRMGQLQAVPEPQRTAAWNDLVGKVKAARACLLDPVQKKRYDERLRNKQPAASDDATERSTQVVPTIVLATSSDRAQAASSPTSNVTVASTGAPVIAIDLKRNALQRSVELPRADEGDPMAPVTIPGLSDLPPAKAQTPIAPQTISMAPAANSVNPSADPSKPLAIALTPSSVRAAAGKSTSAKTAAGRSAKPRAAGRSAKSLSTNAVFLLGIISFTLLIGAFVWIVQVWIRPSQRAIQAEMAAQPSSPRDLPLPVNAASDESVSQDDTSSANDDSEQARPEDANDSAEPATEDNPSVMNEAAREPLDDEPAIGESDDRPNLEDVPILEDVPMVNMGVQPESEGMDGKPSSDDAMPNAIASSSDGKTAMSSSPMPMTMPADETMDSRASSPETPSPAADSSVRTVVEMESEQEASASSAMAREATEKSAREPSDKQRRQTLAALKLAKRAIKDLRMDVAEEQLEKAATLADGSTLVPLVERLDAISELNRKFWEAVDQGLEGLAGEEIEVDGEPVMVVEVDSERLVIHRQGRNQRIARRRMPPRLALAVADRRLVTEDPVSHQIRGAFLAIHAADSQLARDAWKKAESLGADVQQLVESLDDRYDPPSTKGRSAKKPDSMSKADAARP